MAQIVLKTAGVKSPCIICNGMPFDESKEVQQPLPMFHAVGVDVNWGEDCNICQNCVGVMADMMGRADADKVASLSRKHQAIVEKYAELNTEYQAQRERLRKILDGRKATKEQKEKVNA
jgi:hypothetical protein